MTESGEVRIGGKNGEFVSIRRRTQNSSEGWFDAEVEVQCDGWRGKIRASFICGELTGFADAIQVLYDELHGEATLKSLEPHLTLSLVGDGKGRIQIVGTAQNRLDSRTELSFLLEADQTHLPAIVKALRTTDRTERT